MDRLFTWGMDGSLKCSRCGDVIGLWEPIVFDDDPSAEPTTWLKVRDRLKVWGHRIEPGPIWHAECARVRRPG